MSMERRGGWLLLALILATFAIFLVWPIWHIVRIAFVGVTDRGAYFAGIILDPDLRGGLINAGAIAVAVTLLATAISLPLAFLTVRYDFAGKSIVTALLLGPLILPPF